jgi:MoaA/NifB/PqqE/SkfB family radical SAM enzyme
MFATVSKRVNGYLQTLIAPLPAERRARLAQVWADVPESVRIPRQTLGRHSAGCSATHNVLERCNFSCTACYLANTANQTPPLPFDEVAAQLNQIRAHVGPGGGVQLTAGEVTLMPVEDLIRIVRHARAIGLVPMVMTHGETFRDDPEYLERLITEGGLDRFAAHIDTTQRGRRGLSRDQSEREIHWIRDEMADIIRTMRRKTGRTLHAAHTFTVTESNLDGVADVVRWTIDNSDAFRLLSLQPTADVGRTRTKAIAGKDAHRDRLWERVCEGAGASLNPHTLYFGHPRCNTLNFAFVVKFDGETRLVEVARENAVFDSYFMERLFSGGFAGYDPEGDDLVGAAFRLVGALGRDPRSFLEWPAYGVYRAWTERAWLPRFLRAVATGRPWSVHPFCIVIHHFMSREELETEEGRARLDACTFRLPVNGRMVSMCEMNGTDLRRQSNLEVQARLGAREKVSV